MTKRPCYPFLCNIDNVVLYFTAPINLGTDKN